MAEDRSTDTTATDAARILRESTRIAPRMGAPPPAGRFGDAWLAGRPADTASPGPSAARVAVYSLVLPGSGQHVQGKSRWLAYVAVEAAAWYLHLDRRGSGHDLRDSYRELAWEVARDGTGPRVVGDFEYYERLTVWPRSGEWDAEPDVSGLQPETDPATYNGTIWDRATGIFFGPDPDAVGPGDPEWQKALSYYEERAYSPELLWDWTTSGGERRRFAELVHESDQDLKEATVMLGVIVLNHVLSATDAYVSARLREETGGRMDTALSLEPTGIRHGRPGATLAFRVEVRP